MRRATAAQGTRCVGRDARGRRSVGPVPPTDLDSRDQPPEDLAARGRWRNRAPLLVIAAMTLAGALSVVWGVFNQDTLEPLDAASRDRLRQTCVSEQQQLRQLAPITSQSTREDRARRVDDENVILSRIVTTAASLRPPNPAGATALRDWTADWRALLAARAQYASALRGPEARPQPNLPVNGGKPVTKRMNDYSRTHALGECVTGYLQAEILDGVRTYPNQLGID